MKPSSGLSPKSFLGGVVLALVVAIGGCLSGAGNDGAPSSSRSSSAVPSSSSSAPSPAAGGASATVDIQNAAYNPRELAVAVGTTVTWKNLDGYQHTVTPLDPVAWGSPGSGDAQADWLQPQESWSFTFTKAGSFAYRCVPHSFQGTDGKFAGQTGVVVVTEATEGAGAPAGGSASSPESAPAPAPAVSAVRSPVAPARLAPSADGKVHVTLETREVKAKIADGVTYSFWTFDGTVPGPMIRVKEGDTVDFTLKNDPASALAHSIDLHAVTGPGGGARVTQTAPGGESGFTFKALNPGVYVYHCATPHIPTHVANGMYGLIVVEPEEGLPPVDREFYVVQGEIYPTGDLGEKGDFGISAQKLLDEEAEYYLLNGAVGALTGENALTAEVGETVRIWFGVGGFVPSSFHVIGEIFDRVYPEGGFPAVTDVQTTLVPAGGATMVELKVEYPGTYLLVDHWLTHAIDRGAAGHLVVTGPADASVFAGTETAGSGH